MKIELNHAASMTWQPIDDHGTHALIVDDVLANADELRAFACTLAYGSPAQPDDYPGIKSGASLPGAAALKTWVAEQWLQRLFPLQRPAVLRTDDFDDFAMFSVFAVDRSALPPTLQDQHTDGFAWLAMVLHLSREVAGRGTAMWEHRATGLQQWLSADPVRLHVLENLLGLRLNAQLQRVVQQVPVMSNEAVVRAVFQARPAADAFSLAEHPDWRLLSYIPARWNRLVVYPTWQIHSVVDTSAAGELTVDNMRLTYNAMIDYPLPREFRRDRPTYPRAAYLPVRGLTRER